MNKKRGILLLLILSLFIFNSLAVSAARCKFTGEQKLIGFGGLLYPNFPDSFSDDHRSWANVPDNSVVTGVGWNTDGNVAGTALTGDYEAVGLAYSTLKEEDCSFSPTQYIGQSKDSEDYELLRYGDRYDLFLNEYEAFVGTEIPGANRLENDGKEFGCAYGDNTHTMRPIPPETALVGWGGGVCSDNEPVLMSLEVWNISMGFVKNNNIKTYFEGGFYVTIGDTTDKNVCSNKKDHCESEGSKSFHKPELFLGTGKTGFEVSQVFRDVVVPEGWVITGLGTETDSGYEVLTRIRLQITRILVDADEDGIWDNPDEENYDHCVGYDAKTGKFEHFKDKKVFPTGRFAGCTCDQLNNPSSQTPPQGTERILNYDDNSFPVSCESSIPETPNIAETLSKQTCGDTGIDDLGTIQTASDGQSYVCLKLEDKNLVGKAESTSINEIGKCDKDGWCWVNAANNAFNVLTIKNPTAKPFDVVSNVDGWFACNSETSTKTLAKPISAGTSELSNLKAASRFYCYQEGQHWSWAECSDKDRAAKNKNTIKGRYPGEGLYSLYLVDRETNANGELYGSRIEINTQKGAYGDFYGTTDFDFTGYNYLEFMVRYVAGEKGTPLPIDELTRLNVPLNIHLQILGPDQVDESGNHVRVIYVDQPVLGYTVNNPLFGEDNWMHIRVPISDNLMGVKQIIIESEPETMMIGVKNVRLTTTNESALLCSGKDTERETTNWLTDIDQGIPNNPITGKDLCKALYGPKAWLGNDNEVEAPSANCCGNNEQEYYAGKTIEQEDKKRYGCWNSQPIADKETIMNVEFTVGYKEKKYGVQYPDLKFDYNVVKHFLKFYHLSCRTHVANFVSTLYCAKNGKPEQQRYESQFTVVDTISDIEKEGSYKTKDTGNYYDVEKQEKNYGFEPLVMLGPNELPKKINTREEIKLNNPNDLNKNPSDRLIDIALVSTALNLGSPATLYFLDPLDPSRDLGSDIQPDEVVYPGDNTFYIMAKVNENYHPDITSTNENKAPTTKTYTCNQDECLYPLPGEPPYTITNPHPDLYELYFIPPPPAKETLITSPSQQFNHPGNIKARKVAQQVVYVNEGNDAAEQPTFYGCEAADYIQNNVFSSLNSNKQYENLNYCSAKAGKFCAYSVAHKGQTNDPKERFTTINSWSDETIDKVGYQNIPTVSGDVNQFYEQNSLQLRTTGPDLPFDPEARNFSTSVLPARNFVSNAEFLNDGAELPHWEIKGLSPNERERDKVSDKVLNLDVGEAMVSERIAIPADADVAYAAEGTCTPTITVVDKNGQSRKVDSQQIFNTEDASYLRLEYAEPCQLSRPMLQLADEKGPTPYYSLHTGLENVNFDARAGAACCPNKYCWNGYACVEPMSPSTYLSEHIPDGRDYRCLDGQWKYQPVKFDWNRQQWGFCEAENQCFVLSSTAGANSEKKADDFYKGEFPTCVNNKEFIFDNYCDNGNWTSRTKFVATKLLEVGSGNNYVLYCTNYKDAFLGTENFGDKENYLGGETATVQQKTLSLGNIIGDKAQQQVSHLCFTSVNDNPEGKRLIPESKNTCINNVCILKPDNGKVIFATTLNKPITNSNSFLIALNVPQNKLSTICPASEEFGHCDLSGLDLEGDLWYDAHLNAVVYGKKGVQLTPTLLDNVLDFFKGLFGAQSKLSAEQSFVQHAQNFRELYLSQKEDKKVRAVQEIFSDKEQTLVAEYENVDVPICDYIKNRELPPELRLELLSEVSGRSKLSCTQENNLQRVELVKGLYFFWPQLTSQLRAE